MLRLAAEPRWALIGVFILFGASACADDPDRPGPADATGGATGGTAGGTPSNSTGGRVAGGGANEYVRAHNEVRAAVTEPSNYPGTWAPLPDVTWSEEIAETAQDWAQHLADDLGCALEHASGTGYGENLAGSNGALSPAGAVQLWAREKNAYTFAADYRFDPATGHYTQIVWRDSINIGCGSARCGSATVISCRYSPQGNFVGRQPY